MAQDQFVDTVVQRLDEFLNTQESYVPISQRPNSRWVRVYGDTWARWLQTQKKDATPLAPEVAQIALDTLHGLRLPSEYERQQLPRAHASLPDTVVVDRPHLADLARAAVAEPTNGSLALSLWVATMIWGSGTTNGRGPRYLRASLADQPTLAHYLATSVGLAASQRLTPAIAEQTKIAGIGLPFMSKWAWALSLGVPDTPPLLILDSRVRETLSRVDHSAAQGISYDHFIRLADEIASRSSIPGGLAAEDVEFLLFDRSRKRPGDTFVGWLEGLTSVPQ